MKNADAILTSDWHLRETIPTCRTDAFCEVTQWEKVEFVGHLASQHGCPVIHAGDLFHHWKPSPNLIRMCIKHLPVQFWTVYGQHDLPQHNWDLREKSGIAALEEARRLRVLGGTHWGQEPEEASYVMEKYEGKIHQGLNKTIRKILIWHKMVWQGKRLWPGQTDPNSLNILKNYEEYDLIVTGDNHHSFIENYEGRLLVNPGSLTRQNAEQIDFQPRIYLFYADENTVRPVDVPIQQGVVTRVHIERSEERSDRIRAFIEKIKGEWEIGMSFEKNLEEFFDTNPTREEIKNLIYKAIEQ